MAVRFVCPSCHQPLEIDDQWAGQSVACPYCRKVVTAPRESSWPGGEIPVASPAAGGFGPPTPPLPPLPPAGYPQPQPFGPVGYAPRAPQTSGNLGTWALLLAIASTLLSIIGVFIWFAVVGQLALDRVGPNATEQQLQQALQEIMIRRGAPANPAAATALLVGTFCGIVALVLGIRSLIGREGRTGRAIAACVIAAVFVFCQIMLMIAILQQHNMSTSLQAG